VHVLSVGVIDKHREHRVTRRRGTRYNEHEALPIANFTELGTRIEIEYHCENGCHGVHAMQFREGQVVVQEIAVDKLGTLDEARPELWHE